MYLVRAGVKGRVWDAACGKVPTRKMWEKLQGFTPQFTYMNAPWPHDREASDA